MAYLWLEHPFFFFFFFFLSLASLDYLILCLNFLFSFLAKKKKNCPSIHFCAMFGVKIDYEGVGKKIKKNVILNYFIETKKKKKKGREKTLK